MERANTASTSQLFNFRKSLPLRNSIQRQKATIRIRATGRVTFTASSRAPQPKPRGTAAKIRSHRRLRPSSARLISSNASRIRQVYKGSDITMELYISLDGHMLHRKKAAAAALRFIQRRQRA